VHAQFDLPWYAIAGGGAMFTSGGPYDVSGTLGQSQAGPMAGGSFELIGGFWPAASASPPCPGDVDSDNDVDLSDLATLLAHFGTPRGATRADGDLDSDGDVDLTDLAVLLASFGMTCP
jgi:hypothetical protein